MSLINVENCTVYLNGVKYPTSVGWSTNALKIVADEGYYFPDDMEAILRHGSYGNDTTIISPSDSETGQYFNATQTEFLMTGSAMDLIIEEPGPMGSTYSFELSDCIAIEGSIGGGEEPPFDIVGFFTNIYNIEIDQLIGFSEERYIIVDPEPAELETDKYVINLFTIPYNIDSITSAEPEPIKIAGKTFTTESKVTTSSIATIGLGEIDIEPQYNNAYDYLNTEVLLHVPHGEPIRLDTSTVIGKTVSVQLNIDLYTGEGTYNIILSPDDYVIESKLIHVGRNVPITKITDKEATNRTMMNGVITPFIEVRRNVPYNEVGGVGNQISQVDVIGNLAGYVEVEKVHLETSASKREQEMITSQLRNGVIIQ